MRDRQATAAPAAHTGAMPWVKLRSAASGHQVFRRMLDQVDPRARPGDLVAVYDKADAPYGLAVYNPRSVITLRLLTRGIQSFDPDDFFRDRLRNALELREHVLSLGKTTDAYRLIHDQGDGLPGLVVDRYGEYIVLEFYSLGMFRQAERLERLLSELIPGAKFVHRASEYTEKMEGFRIEPGPAVKARIQENGVVYELNLSGGYKTGFFCDQRDNRAGVAALAAGRSVLDVCSYTGGFGITAAKLGGATDVTCVELDPEASAQGERNAKLNKVKINSVCTDAFPYLRQMAANGNSYDLVILDPYKLIGSREGFRLGRQKYIDLNKLGLPLVKPGGLFLTCSCSGLLSAEEFGQVVRTAAATTGRRVQILRKSGAGADHPVAVDHPEGEYLKCLWCRVL
jgi:23S rRNA (cytosine1962-C5)-methyltransferase